MRLSKITKQMLEMRVWNNTNKMTLQILRYHRKLKWIFKTLTFITNQIKNKKQNAILDSEGSKSAQKKHHRQKNERIKPKASIEHPLGMMGDLVISPWTYSSLIKLRLCTTNNDQPTKNMNGFWKN